MRRLKPTVGFNASKRRRRRKGKRKRRMALKYIVIKLPSTKKKTGRHHNKYTNYSVSLYIGYFNKILQIEFIYRR